MHHPSLLRCLTMLGLSTCTATPVSSAEVLEPEPSGLGMGEHTLAPVSDDGRRFVAQDSQWCDVMIDPRGRALEPTSSLLQAWNLVADDAQPVMRYVAASPLTEADARTRICGRADCEVEQPQLFEATIGGLAMREQDMRAGFGVIVPSDRGALVVPIAGSRGSCSLPHELRTTREGSLVHVTTLVHEGEYSRYYFHGESDGHYGHTYGGGGCERLASTRVDIVIDVETAQLELVLTQARRGTEPQVDVRLLPHGVELRGCDGVLELAWTG